MTISVRVNTRVWGIQVVQLLHLEKICCATVLPPGNSPPKSPTKLGGDCCIADPPFY